MAMEKSMSMHTSTRTNTQFGMTQFMNEHVPISKSKLTHSITDHEQNFRKYNPAKDVSPKCKMNSRSPTLFKLSC